MSYQTLRNDAERMHIPLWHLPRERRFRKKADTLRTEIIERVYGPGHPGFKGKPAEVDAHVTTLVDCAQGRHGRALQIAINAHGASQRAAAELTRLAATARPNKADVEFAAADLRQWAAVSSAAYAVYSAARAVRGEDALRVLEMSEADYSKPLSIPAVLPAATVNVGALVLASHEAIRNARHETDTAPRRPTEFIPGFEEHVSPLTVPQTLARQLERFGTKLETQLEDSTTA